MSEPKAIRAAAVRDHQCPRCKAKPGEPCTYDDKPRTVVCCERYTKAKKGVR